MQYYPAQMKHLGLDVHISAVLNRKLDALLNGVCARKTCSRSPPATKGSIVYPVLPPPPSPPAGLSAVQLGALRWDHTCLLFWDQLKSCM